TLPVEGPFQLLGFFLDGFGAHGPQALGEELGIGAVQGRDERLQTPLLHDSRTRLPDLQNFEHGFPLRLDLAHEVIKIPCRVMYGLLEDVGQFLGAEGNAAALEYLSDKALPRFALSIEDRNL